MDATPTGSGFASEGTGASSGAAPEVGENKDEERALYGGAMRAVLPSSFVDVSKVRPVPDHQEVFSNVDTDSSIIFEINEYQGDVSDGDAAAYHFRDLGEAADCAASDIAVELTAPLTPEDMPAIASAEWPAVTAVGLVGTQRISKFREGADAKNTVRIFMAVVRIPSKTSDVLITLNVPCEVSESSSSYKTFSGSVADPGDAMSLFKAAIASFNILDWGLFGEE